MDGVTADVAKPSDGPGRGPVERYLDRLRRRAAWFHLARTAMGLAGAGCLAFGLAALLVGPVGGPITAGLAWVLVAGCAGAVVVWGIRAFQPFRGAGAARLLAVEDPALPSSVRSAVELGGAVGGGFSADLALAHRARVASRLATIPPSRLVDASWLRHRAAWGGALALAVGALLLTQERGRAGAYALVHAADRLAQEGPRRAAIFGPIEVHVVYPSYLDRAPVDVFEPSVLEVPRGTTLEVRAAPRAAGLAAELSVGEDRVQMERDGDRFLGRVVVREAGPLHLRLEEAEERWVEDAADREVRLLLDEAPRVQLLDPVADLVVDAPQQVPVAYEASDDVGLRAVELVVRGPDGEERRRRLGVFEDLDAPGERSGRSSVELAPYGLSPGDRVTIWVEARDGDVVSGPNVGRSAARTITLASEATRRRERLTALEGVLDLGLSALADRLERPPPEEREEAPARFRHVRGSATRFVEALFERTRAMEDEDGARAADRALLEQIGQRVRRDVRREASAHRAPVGMIERRRELDGQVVEDLEDGSLRIDDLLTRSRVEDAAAITRELEELRREMRSLLSELRRTDSPEAREALLRAIGRAQDRMRDLMQRLGEMGTRVPQEFMNAGEMPSAQESSDALTDLREAVQRGDLDAADRLVGQLEAQIDRLARALGQTEEGFVESRFGPRERALAEAMDDLAGLEAEQQQLADRGVQRRSRAAGRALEEAGGPEGARTERLGQAVEDIQDALQEIDRDGLAGFEQDSFDRAMQRLQDTRDALRTGDLGEAQRMAAAAAQDMASLSRDLDLSALMFPGAEGERRQEASRATEANRGLRQLRRELDEALPDVRRFLQGSDLAEMRDDARGQRGAREAAAGLAQRFGEGAEGEPLSPEASEELQQIGEVMGEARGQLRDGDPLESARLQEEAAQRLSALRERLEQDEQRGGGGGGGGEGGQGGLDLRRPVEIPGAEQFESPMEMRRRLLDAMQQEAPPGFEDAVRQYYEGLLR